LDRLSPLTKSGLDSVINCIYNTVSVANFHYFDDGAKAFSWRA